MNFEPSRRTFLLKPDEDAGLDADVCKSTVCIVASQVISTRMGGPKVSRRKIAKSVLFIVHPGAKCSPESRRTCENVIQQPRSPSSAAPWSSFDDHVLVGGTFCGGRVGMSSLAGLLLCSQTSF